MGVDRDVEVAIQDVTHYRRIMQATEHQQAGRLTEARDIYIDLLEDNPEDANALHLLGMLAHQAGNSYQGIRLVEKAVQLIPDSPLYMNNLGQMYLSLRQLDKAEELFLKATRTDTDMPAPLYGLAECYRCKGDLQHAANFIEYVLEREPQHVDAIVSLGLIHLKNNSAQKALELFDIALTINPEHIDAMFHQARAYFSLSQYDESITILTDILQKSPEYDGCYNNLGNAFMATQRFDEAVEAYQKVVDHNPTDVDMRYNLALALVESGRPDAANEQLKIVLGIKSEHSRARTLMIKVKSDDYFTKQETEHNS